MKPDAISRFRKERFLLAMSEDTFRDEVVRPLFLRQGLKDGRDLCGPLEKGKDTVFLTEDKLGIVDLYAVQTKRGALNMSRKVTESVVEAITQLKTALATPVTMLSQHRKIYPSKVFLCCSGKVNDSAQNHILSEVRDPRVAFLGSEELIPRIDEHFHELWLGIDSEAFPYLRAVMRMVEVATDDAAYSGIVPEGAVLDAATDNMFVQLRLHRSTLKPQTRLGQVTQVMQFEELPVTGVISRRDRLVLILGDAGSGKSTSMKRLAYVLASRGLQSAGEFKIPILIRATEIWASSSKSLTDCLIASAKRLINSNNASFSNEDLSNGRLVVLVDALDELGNDDSRRAVIEKARSFHKDNPQCQVIVTSRDYAFIHDLQSLSDFTQFHLSPINHKQAQQILQRLERKRSLPAEKCKEILRRIEEVHGMELNPLLVTVFAATTDYSRRDIPANITELFKKFTEMMLGRWDRSKGLGQQYHAPLKDFLLQRVAYEMHRRQRTTIPVEELRRIIYLELTNRGHKADIDQILDEILNRSGLVRVVSDSVEFRHHLLQEFFAGRGIPHPELLENYVVEEWWQRAVVFYFGERPNELRGFDMIIKALTSKTPQENFTAAMSVGLSLQACYLLPLDEKTKIYPWVLVKLAQVCKDVAGVCGQERKYPLTTFIAYYLLGRDSVACEVLNERFDQIVERALLPDMKPEDSEVVEFWLIVGLIEIGQLEKAKVLLKKYHPKDVRLLLAIHLGCVLLEHLRVATKEQCNAASEIARSLNAVIVPLREQLIGEFKSHLLEIRKGKIHAIEPPDATQTEIEGEQV